MKTIIGLVALVALWASEALACTPTPGWDAKARLSVDAAARIMSTKATYIDVVSVERLTPDFEFATRSRREWTVWDRTPGGVGAAIEGAREDYGDGVKIHLRIVHRLKGVPQSGFTLNGLRRPDWMPQKPARPIKLSELHQFRNLYDFADWPAGAICQVPIYVSVGERFLIFRDAQGRLLQANVPYSFEGKAGEITGPAIAPIVNETDPWPIKVMAAMAVDRVD